MNQKAIIFMYPEFAMGPVPAKVAAKAIGIAPDTLLNKMESKELDIGFIDIKPKKRGVRVYRNAYISPKKLWELTGYIWRGAEEK